jgi:hypothetical protein
MNSRAENCVIAFKRATARAVVKLTGLFVVSRPDISIDLTA